MWLLIKEIRLAPLNIASETRTTVRSRHVPRIAIGGKAFFTLDWRGVKGGPGIPAVVGPVVLAGGWLTGVL